MTTYSLVGVLVGTQLPIMEYLCMQSDQRPPAMLLQHLDADGYALLPGVIPRTLIVDLRRRALAFASAHSAAVMGAGQSSARDDGMMAGIKTGGLLFADLLAPEHEAALRPMMSAALGSEAVQAALREAFNGSEFAFTGVGELQLNRTRDWHRELLHEPYLSTQKHDAWMRTSKGETYSLFQLIFFLEAHDSDGDGEALSVIPGSHRMRGCSLPCGSNKRGYVEAPDEWASSPTPPLRDPVALRPAIGDALLLDLRLIRRAAYRSHHSSGLSAVGMSFGKVGSIFTQEHAEGGRLRQRDALVARALGPQPSGGGLRHTCAARAQSAWRGEDVTDGTRLHSRSAFNCFPSSVVAGRRAYALPATLAPAAAIGAARAAGAASPRRRRASLQFALPPALRSLRRPATCTLVGPSGVLRGSGCGRRIDGTDGPVFRTFDKKLPVGGALAADVGRRVDVVLKAGKADVHNISIGAHLASWARSNRVEGNMTALLLDGCYDHVGEEWAAAASDAARIAPNLRLMPLASAYTNCVDRYWRRRAAPNSPVRWSSGLLLASLALDLCDHVDVYGFWPFATRGGKRVAYHYNEARPAAVDKRVVANHLHDWVVEWGLLTSHTTQAQGLTVHTGVCS